MPNWSFFYHKALSASLAEAESSSRCLENEVKESIEKMARAEAGRDAARCWSDPEHMYTSS